MPTSRKTTKAAMAAAAAMPSIPKELIDQFVTGPMSAEAVNAASMAFKKALIERALGAELSHHLGYRPGATKREDANNHRNGASGKTVLTEDGPLRIDVPRDRDGSFEPLLIPKHDRRFTGFDDKIVAMYARGMTVREIQGFLAEQYGTEVAPDFISSVTDAVMAEVGAWQARPLEPMYPAVFFDALRVKIREDAVVRNKATFFAQAEDAAGADLPQFIKDEFDAFPECGILAHGFLRLHCGDCGHDKLVAFSCKRRGFCPSCGARRMAQTAAHLVDHVIPHVPVRQPGEGSRGPRSLSTA